MVEANEHHGFSNTKPVKDIPFQEFQDPTSQGSIQYQYQSTGSTTRTSLKELLESFTFNAAIVGQSLKVMKLQNYLKRGPGIKLSRGETEGEEVTVLKATPKETLRSRKPVPASVTKGNTNAVF